MTTKINDNDELMAAIDEFGAEQVRINALVAAQKVRKQLIEAYANENGLRALAATDYRLTMTPGKPALLRLGGVSEEDVIALLKESETARVFVTETYDSDALKAQAKKTGYGDGWLAQFGLTRSTPQRHAVVSAI